MGRGLRGPRVSGRVEVTRTASASSQAPRPDTATTVEAVALTVSLFAVLLVLSFGPAWLDWLITH